MAVPAGPPIALLFSLLAVVLGGRRSLPPLSSHSPLMVSLRMADKPGPRRPCKESWRVAVEVWCQASVLAGVLIKMMLTMRIQHRTRHGAVAVVPHPTAL